jgi:hypothetical protein
MVAGTRLNVTLYVDCLSCKLQFRPDHGFHFMVETRSLIIYEYKLCLTGLSIYCALYLSLIGAWGGVVVKALRY